jgi:anti-sigma regulatory factor (Ser/Thr protein kinase)
MIPPVGAAFGQRRMADLRHAIRLTVTATLDRLPALLEAVGEVCDAAGTDASTRHDLRLAVEEACVNVMRHAYRDREPGELTLDVAHAPWQGVPAIRVLVQDHGMPFDPLQLAAPQLGTEAEQLSIGGLGVHLMRQVVDVLRYHHDAATGNNLMLVKYMNRGQGERA